MVTPTTGVVRRSTLLVVVVAVMVTVLTAMRVVFWAVFTPYNAPLAVAILTRAFYLGLKFDLRFVLLTLVPFAVLGAFRRLDPSRNESARRFWLNHLSALMALMAVLYAVDFAHYAYLGERLDTSALRYLNNPIISLVMVWESYPVIWVLLGILAFGVACRWVLGALWSKCAKTKTANTRDGSRWRKAWVGSVVVIAYLGGIYGKMSYFPLRWSDAFFTTDRFVSHLALNPLLFFANTLCTAEGELAYDIDEWASRCDVVAEYVGAERCDREDLGLARYVRPSGAPDRPVNVVLIFAESLAAGKTGAFGNPLDASPQFDAIAAESVLYTNFYTPSFGTAKGVFATLIGIPDTITYRTASRNPSTIRNHTILRSFESHKKFYFLGGSANWANIRALFSYNLDDVEIYEEGSYESERVDGWGIPDYVLMEEANRVLSNVEDGPFFAFIHLAGNHRPYTIPDDIPGFELREVDNETLRRNGFRSLAEFNSFRLLDHSIGHFVEIARKEDYFRNTLIVISSDNGGLGPSESPRTCGETLDLDTYHAPLVFYGPALTERPRVVESMASQLDILPTVASLAGIPALNTALGRDLTDPRFEDNGFAFFYRKRGSAGEIGMIDRDAVMLVGTDGADPRYYLCESNTPAREASASMPERVKRMTELALGMFHASKYLMYHNASDRYDELGLTPVKARRLRTGAADSNKNPSTEF